MIRKVVTNEANRGGVMPKESFIATLVISIKTQLCDVVFYYNTCHFDQNSALRCRLLFFYLRSKLELTARG